MKEMGSLGRMCVPVNTVVSVEQEHEEETLPGSQSLRIHDLVMDKLNQHFSLVHTVRELLEVSLKLPPQPTAVPTPAP